MLCVCLTFLVSWETIILPSQTKVCNNQVIINDFQRPLLPLNDKQAMVLAHNTRVNLIVICNEIRMHTCPFIHLFGNFSHYKTYVGRKKYIRKNPSIGLIFKNTCIHDNLWVYYLSVTILKHITIASIWIIINCDMH